MYVEDSDCFADCPQEVRIRVVLWRPSSTFLGFLTVLAPMREIREFFMVCVVLPPYYRHLGRIQPLSQRASKECGPNVRRGAKLPSRGRF